MKRLRRLALDDAGYTLAYPALVLVETVLSQTIIRKVSFTEIDFQTYLGQSALFIAGERDYSKLDPVGGSGPCVYPAGHVYLYSLLYKLTNGGVDILPAQYAFQALLTATTLLVAALYRQAGLPPILTATLLLSKRIHSIFLLRMFNDPAAMFFVYVGLYLATRRCWALSSAALSLGLGIKMNVLLFLPGLLVAVFVQTGFWGTVRYLLGIVLVQAVLSLPFTLHDAEAYWTHAFDFSRAFLYQWTVNWKFVPETTFSSPLFARGLLAAHAALLGLFGLFKWTQIGLFGLYWLLQKRSPQSGRATRVGLLCMAFTSNVIGVMCSRSLHYQFYAWYFHQVPLLLWFSKLPLVVKLGLPVCLEWCWNVFPSTPQSSLALLLCHVVLVGGCSTTPVLTTAVPKPATGEDEVEVELLLSNEAVPASDPPADAEQVAVRQAEVLAKEAAKEQAEMATFQRRIAVRRRIVSVLGRGVLLLRSLLILAAVALFFVMLHPNSPVSKGTYVDENALQPGQSRVYWDYFDVTHADMLSEKVARLGAVGTSEARADFVLSELASYGLDAHVQHYRYRRSTSRGFVEDDGRLEGWNAYARSATARIDGREAIILTASWQSQWHGDESTNHTSTGSSTEPEGKVNVRGVASLLALARYLSTQAHLSKDLIFVVSDGHLEGINAWSSTFFGSRDMHVDADPVRIGGSHVWNAISLDYPADSFSSLVVQYEGLNGQLPNMDVVNTLVRVAERVANGVPTYLTARSETTILLDAVRRLSDRWEIPLRSDVERELRNYEQGARAAARQFGHGAAGSASGPHGVFQRYHVDAITIFAVPATGPYGFYHIGRIVEAFIRSMSNLLERLHHSQFFYLLLTPYRFVPIGIVILIPLFLSISMTISGMQIWYQEEAVSKGIRRALFANTDAGLLVDVDDVEPESPTIAWYRSLLVERWTERRRQDSLDDLPDGPELDQVLKLNQALTSSMRPYQSAVLSIVASLICASLTLATLSNMSYDDVQTLPSNVSTVRAPFSRIIVVDTQVVPSLHPQTRVCFACVLLCMLLTVGLAVGLRWQHMEAARMSRLLHAFAGVQAGMGVAVLSVLNFGLATVMSVALITVLTIARLRIPMIVRIVVVTVVMNPFAWLVTAPVLPAAVAETVVQSAQKALHQWVVLGSTTVPIVLVLYLPILLQVQTSLVLLCISPTPFSTIARSV